jgi:hypothetical protein
VHGFEEVKVFYTDNCCQEYDTLIRCFDSLTRQDGNFVQPLKVPALLKLPCQSKVKTLNTYAHQLVPVAVEVLEHLDSRQEETLLVIGFDLEWDSLTVEQRSNSHPEILQLATADGSLYDFAHIMEIYNGIPENGRKDKPVLASILRHRNALLVGVHVNNDTTFLIHHYPNEFMGAKDTLKRKYFELAVQARCASLIVNAQGEGKLASLLQIFDEQGLDKVNITSF